MFIEKDGEWVTIAYATQLELDCEARTIKKASTSAGGWIERKKRRKSWTMNARHLMSDVQQRVELEALVASRQTVNVMLALVPTGGFYYGNVEPAEAIVQGAVHFTRLSITAEKGSMSVLDLSMTGQGELTQASLN